MFDKLKGLFNKTTPDVYVPEDEDAAEAFDPGYKPSKDDPGYVPGHPEVNHHE